LPKRPLSYLSEIHNPIVEILMKLVQAAVVFIFAAKGKGVPTAILSGLIPIQEKQDTAMILHEKTGGFKERERVKYYKIVAVFFQILLDGFKRKKVHKTHENDCFFRIVLKRCNSLRTAAYFEVRVADFKASQIVLKPDAVVSLSAQLVTYFPAVLFCYFDGYAAML